MGADEKKGEVAKLEKELHDLKAQPAKWTKERTIYDRLPPYEKPFNIEPFRDERERLPFKMTDEDRLRRKRWVHSQELSEREPVRVPELEKQLFNPIRRLYRAPADKIFKALEPLVVRNL